VASGLPAAAAQARRLGYAKTLIRNALIQNAIVARLHRHWICGNVALSPICENTADMNSSRRFILRGACALIGDDFDFDGRPRDFLIENGRIKSIALAGKLEGAEVVDLSRHLLAPGLINGHFHSHEHFQKGRTENLPLELWTHHVRTLIPVVLNARQTYLRTLIGAIEALHSGTTLVLDDLALGSSINRENLNAVFQAYEDIGIRALVGFAMMNRPIVESFPFVEAAFSSDVLQQMLQIRPADESDLLGLCEELANRHPLSKRVGLVISASAPQRCTDEFLMACRQLADKHDLPMVTHVQETRLQVVTGLLFYGKPIVEHLAEIGFLSPRTTLIHAVWLNPREIESLARTGATAQHNPWSNMTLGSGYQPVRPLLDAGVNVSLGSDGTCSTSTANMLTVLGSAAAMSKIRGDDYSKWLSAKEALSAATRAGANAFGFGEDLGVIRTGAIADLVGYRLDSIAFTPLTDPVRQLVYAERGAGVDFSMIDGRIVMKAGRLLGIDETRILAEISEEYERLKSQFDRAEGSIAPMLHAMEKIYRRSLATPIAPDTYPARFP
jgi:guanine deaminase